MNRVLLHLRERELSRAKDKEWAASVCDRANDERAADLRFQAAQHRINAEALREALEDAGVVFIPAEQPPLFREMH